MNLLALNGFNPFGLDSWSITQYLPQAAPLEQKRNWTRKDEDYVATWYTSKYGNDPYIITCHSDGATIAHNLAHSDTRCIGLHVQAGIFFTPRVEVRDIPVYITWNERDWTGMGRCSRRAFEWYIENSDYVVMKDEFISQGWLGHGYKTCLPALKYWCKHYCNYDLETTV